MTRLECYAKVNEVLKSKNVNIISPCYRLATEVKKGRGEWKVHH